MSTLSCLAKLAVISEEEHRLGMQQMYEKQKQLAEARGIKLPPGDTSGVRMSRVGQHPAMEAEIIKAHNPHAGSLLSRAKHQWVNPVKRLLQTPMGKAIGIGALGATGLGIYHGLKNQRVPQPEQYQLSPQDREMLMQQLYAKTGAMTGPSTIPTPPPLPRVSTPGPAVGNLPSLPRQSASLSSGFPKLTTKIPSTPSVEKASVKKADIDPAIAALLAGGGGGGAGYWAGKKMLPFMENREASILREIAEKQRSLENLQTLKRYTPIGIAALGAVALASLAAAKARASERMRSQPQGPIYPYDPSGMGYSSSEQVPFMG